MFSTRTIYSKSGAKNYYVPSSKTLSAKENWNFCPFCFYGIAPQEKGVQRLPGAVFHDTCLKKKLIRNELNKLPEEFRKNQKLMEKLISTVASRIFFTPDESFIALENLFAFYENSFGQSPDFHLLAGYKS